MLASFLALLSGLLAVVGVAEIVQAGANSAYYAVKLFVLVLEYAAVIMAAGVATALGVRGSRETILAAATSVAAVSAAASGIGFYLSHTATPPARSVREAALYLQHTRHMRSGDFVLAYDGCGMGDRFLSHAFANLSGEFSPALNNEFAKFMNAKRSNIDGLRQLASDRRVSNLVIVTSRPCEAGQLRQLSTEPGVTVIGS
jgi:hypothetical protein